MDHLVLIPAIFFLSVVQTTLKTQSRVAGIEESWLPVRALCFSDRSPSAPARWVPPQLPQMPALPEAGPGRGRNAGIAAQQAQGWERDVQSSGGSTAQAAPASRASSTEQTPPASAHIPAQVSSTSLLR